MKRTNGFTHLRRLTPALFTFGLLLSGWITPLQAQTEDMPFSVEIYPYGITGITIINESRERIIGFTITSGDTAVPFDRVYDGYVYGPSGRTSTPFLIEPDYTAGGPTTDTLRFAGITSFEHGDRMTFYVDTSPLYANTAKTMFNNGSKPNSVVTVFGADGGRGELTLSDTLYNTLYETYRFRTETRPRTLRVNSLTQDGGGFVPNFSVMVRDASGAIIEQYNNPNHNVVISYLSDGSSVDITAVQGVYMDADGIFIYDSNTIPSTPEGGPQPRERFVATGLSVNNTPQTGDPTRYSFDISADTEVELRWSHEYALLINHNFDRTESPELDPTEKAWAGPLTSAAAGNPSPDTTKIHWIPEGQEVLAQVDGQVVDFTRPGLDIRYVPLGYLSQGSARGVFQDPLYPVYPQFFSVGQAPPQRQQVNAFLMDGWGIIEYVWQIQFGVKINVDDPSRSALPRVFLVTPVDGQEVAIGSLEGTFWFNPEDEVKVASAANVAGPTSQALTGWISGDGYYFSSDGSIDSQNGSLTSGGPTVGDDGPVAVWQPSFFDVNGRQYRGLSIPALRRPARVVWQYGSQSYAYQVKIGEYLFQNNEAEIEGIPELAAVVRTEPSTIEMISISGGNKQIAGPDMAVWDPNALRLYPVVPGQFRVVWNTDAGAAVQVLVTAVPPEQAHYPHIAGTPPVQLDPDPDDTFVFKALCYTENEAAIESTSLFSADAAGLSVLLFGEIQRIGRGEPKEFLRVRVVETKRWDEDVALPATAIIGQKISDPELDLAELGTGYLMFDDARYNPNVYDASALDGLAARDLYDMPLLRSTSPQRVVVSRGALPGPIIPVNLHPGALPTERLVVVWYYDPTLTDEIMWPHAARVYLPRWPTTEAEGLGRIVIASQYGSESLNAAKTNQVVAPEVTSIVPDGSGGTVTNVYPATISYDPSRIQQAAIYVQNNRTRPGYNPNEEHALMAPSLRYAQVSPRPLAAYALRNNDLNLYNPSAPTEAGQPPGYTSHPYVLVQYFDTADSQFKMKVYTVLKEDFYIPNYRFVNQGLVTLLPGATQVTASAQRLNQEPRVLMEAGEPVIPFYPLGVVIGASPSPESFGINIKDQTTYWEDHKGTSWAVSGGTPAWFTFSIYYPLAPDFWWPEGEPGRIAYDPDTEEKRAAFPFVGDSVAFMPPAIAALHSLEIGSLVPENIEAYSKPNLILYKSDWPAIAPTLKAGETLTYSGGEYRTDHPTMLVADENGDLKTVETPGLPAVLGFAVGEIAFDALNPKGSTALLDSSWTARMGQVLDVRSVVLPIGDFPGALLPASGGARVSGGKYILTDLPASLQKRIRYDPLAQSRDRSGLLVNGRLELTGVLNDKTIASPTLTAAPPAVYVLEPNILTSADVAALLALSEDPPWVDAVTELAAVSMNPTGIEDVGGQSPDGKYLVGLQPKVNRDPVTDKPILVPIEYGSSVLVPETDPMIPEPARQFGPGIAIIPNGDFMDPTGTIDVPGSTPVPYPDVSWITVAENNDPSLGGAPVTLHVIKVDRRERYRGAIKVVLSDNVFDENVVLRHTGEFGANPDDLVYEWWYRPDDGALNVLPPYVEDTDSAGDWKLFPDPSGNRGLGRSEVTVRANPNTPEILLADSWWFARYRHRNDVAADTDWHQPQPNGDDEVNFTWAGAGNNDPFNDFDLNGYPDYRAQLSMGWIKRVLDAVNPYEARINDFEGESPATTASMLQQLGPRFEGPVALNPDQDVIENVGLIELYETVLKRASDLSIDLSTPVSTPATANALQLASTRLSDFYALLANEAYTDAVDPTIGFGSSSVEYGTMAPVVFSFQNQLSSLMEEELSLLHGVDNYFARPVYNRLFWNFTKGEGEAAYAMNYNITDITEDGFINEDDAMTLYPQGHGDAWGHYLTALKQQYDLLRHPYFNWVSRSEFYNLMDIVIPVDFLDERKFAQIAASKARAGAEIVNSTYREKFVEDPTAQWQGYTDVNPDRAWGVQGWARRTAQGAYFDWVTANALLPSQHPNEALEGIQKVDRQSNDDIKVVSANLNSIQRTFENANDGLNPLGVAANAVPFDINTEELSDLLFGRSHFEQIYDRALKALENAVAVWDNANLAQNRLRQVANTEATFRNEVYQEDISYRNRLIELFGRPYDGTVGPGKLYPAGYSGPDLALYMYVDVNEINSQTVPGPSLAFAEFDGYGKLNGGDLYTAFPALVSDEGSSKSEILLDDSGDDLRDLFAGTFAPDNSGESSVLARDGYYAVNYTDLSGARDPQLTGFAQLMPVKASGYTFEAPSAWGSRPAAGELQLLINSMIQQEAEIARAIAAWDALTGEIIRAMRLADAQLATGKTVSDRNADFVRAKYIINNTLKGIRGTKDILDAVGSQVESVFEATADFLPTALPTAGLSISPGDALAPGRGATLLSKVTVKAGIDAAETALRIAELVEMIALDIAENEVNLANDAAERLQAKREVLKGVEDLVGDEPSLRIAIFKEIEALRALSDQYRSKVAEGARLIDERAAYNKRVAAMTQQNRYQDMAFRVTRNHALEVYHATFDLAARYAYLAAKAYDYETNLDVADPASPRDLYADIVKARTPGLLSGGVPQFGAGGLAESLAWLDANYASLRGQMGFNNPQKETGKLSLRTELFRILPTGSVQPTGDEQFPGGGQNSDLLWQQTLQNARVDNLWSVPEYRYFARPFASDIDAEGNAAVEPGLVLRFGTTIVAGNNFFGHPLSGGDHAYDPSLFATKIRSVGVWFSNYISDDVLNGLPEAPRVYLIPVGSDVMSIANSLRPDRVRFWKILDQQIPVPYAAVTSSLDRGDWVPLLDSLNGSMGKSRRFSSFRAYHDAGGEVLLDELVADNRLVGRSVWNTGWMLIIPGLTLNSDPDEGLDRFISQVKDIKLIFETYGNSGN